MSQNESPLGLLQECVVAGGSPSDVTANSNNMRCRPRGGQEESSSPVDLFMDVMRTKAASVPALFSSKASSKANAHAALRQDFNLSTRVWGATQ
ncbi:hypothetical protein ACHAXT_012526 [Thalassiosira profunda]